MATNYTRWYRVGTVSVTQGSKNVTGTSTYWLASALNPGDMFSIDNGQSFYEIDEIVDSSHITLKTAYTGETLSDISYSITRFWGSTDDSKVAAIGAELLGDFAQYIDLEMQTIRGKSAYEVAVQNGFSGTQNEWLDSLSAYGVARKNGYTGTLAEWLESLKAAGEWSTASERLDDLEADSTAAKTSIATLEDKVSIFGHNGNKHNGIWGGRNLGTSVTAEQLANIANGTFKDMYIGDYWVLNGRTYHIMHFNYCPYISNHIMLMGRIATGAFQFHSTADNTMGVLGSDIYTQTLTEWSPIVNEDFGGHLSKAVTNGICSSVNSSGNFGSYVQLEAADSLYIMLPSLFEINKAHLAIRNNPLEYPPEGTERGGPFAYFRFRSYYPIGGGADSHYWMRDPGGVNYWWQMHNNCRPFHWTRPTGKSKHLVIECILKGA